MVRSLILKVFVPIGVFFSLFQMFPAPSQVAAFSSNGSVGQVADLKDQLEKGLRARLPTDFAFIEKVINLVNHGKLPQKLVLGTFDYARKKSLKRPFPYFERALRLRAAKIGVTI
jgi:hypothetical protein